MANEPPQAKPYQRVKLTCSVIGTGIFLLYAGLWVCWGGDAILRWTDSRWLGLLCFAGLFGLVLEVLTLPLDYFADFVVEHRFGLSNQTRWRWFSQTLKGWGVGGLLSGLVLGGLYSCLWYTGDYWWLWVWISWIGLTVVLAQLFPVLLLPVFYKSTPLDDEAITADLTHIAEGTSIRVEGIFSLDLSSDTKAANAMLTGLGSTRRVYLSDTLLESFSGGEIKVIFAHELGHHIYKHIWKLLVLSSVFASVHIGVLVYFLHPLRGLAAEHWPAAVAALPLCALVMAAIGLVVKPLHNAISRHFERQCDREALQRTQDPESYRSAFQRLAEMNLADPRPHPFVEWYFHDHPSIAKRLAMAEPHA